jgi:hypothetical protein
MMPRGIMPAKIIDQTTKGNEHLWREGMYIEVLTERDSFVSSHWVLDGLIIEGKHAVERIYEDGDLI